LTRIEFWPSDQPAVIEFKPKTLAALGAQPTAEHRTVSIDLRDDWSNALLNHGFERSHATAWIAEGLLIYLPPHAQDHLFDSITQLSAPGSHLATEYVRDASAFSDEQSQRVSDGFRRYGFDMEMSDLVYEGERSPVVEYLTARGWDITAQTLEEAYAANALEMPDDEMFTAFADTRVISGVLAGQNGCSESSPLARLTPDELGRPPAS
jgi:methyltransferase (TIGR00027 family)